MDTTVKRAALGAAIFTLLVPCTVAGVAPYFLIISRSQLFAFDSSPVRASGAALFMLGLPIYAWCVYDFVFAGRGTPSPTHPPSALVVRGLYRYSRNPMYVGVCAVLFGEALYFGSGNQLVYALCALAGFHLRVVLGEERTLRRTFGAAYEDYCARVPRWIGRVKKGGRDGD
ncbi:MAG: isoprenylcysteine carboxylmethyltransferase family protein [Candidatus Hydrogenedentes bacterium]|nr:isoprenylcysteine carboxylmethyltransferase family protein [Candidatus Hydrogenedentota bacterium]